MKKMATSTSIPKKARIDVDHDNSFPIISYQVRCGAVLIAPFAHIIPMSLVKKRSKSPLAASSQSLSPVPTRLLIRCTLARIVGEGVFRQTLKVGGAEVGELLHDSHDAN
jgi:hypothetical protein